MATSDNELQANLVFLKNMKDGKNIKVIKRSEVRVNESIAYGEVFYCYGVR
jgi:hypothetical protein